MADINIEKIRKIASLVAVPIAPATIPDVPKLPKFFRERYPDHAAEFDAYDQSWVDFFKRSGTAAR